MDIVNRLLLLLLLLHVPELLPGIVRLPVAHAVWTDFELVRPWFGAWGSTGNKSYVRISRSENNGPQVPDGSSFGSAVTSIGDLDGDGIVDIAVGSRRETTFDLDVRYVQTGAVYILFMNNMYKSGPQSAAVRSSKRISRKFNGGPNLNSNDNFGCSLTSYDLDGDGRQEIFTGTTGDYISGVYILYMNSDGTVSSYRLIRGPYIGQNTPSTSPVFPPTPVPSPIPTGDPTLRPTHLPTFVPTIAPSAIPTPNPSFLPSADPGLNPTMSPTPGITTKPTRDPDVAIVNGPPISYQSNFGSSLAAIGDWDKDGTPDLLVGSAYSLNGAARVYLLLMTPNGTVRDYKWIEPGGDQGLPQSDVTGMGSNSFSDFGSAIVAIGDLDLNNVTDIAIGARYMDVSVTSKFRAGQTFILMLNQNFTVNEFGYINELPVKGLGTGLPNKDNDNCGTALAYIGDINMDDKRQHHWYRNDEDLGRGILAYGDDKGRRSLPDVIIGCPMTLNQDQDGGGKYYLTFLNKKGFAEDYCEMPTKDDEEADIAPKLQALDQFGGALGAYEDVDQNGIREIIVGAPGDHESAADTGAIYIMFTRRRRFHRPFVDHLGYILSISLPLGICCLCCIGSTAFFFWYFRRKPDEVELAVKAAGLERTKDRQRKKQEFGKDGKVYADEYVA